MTEDADGVGTATSLCVLASSIGISGCRVFQLTDSSAASLQMIDEIQGIAGWKTRQPGDARHGKGKKGGTGILGVGCVLCWLFFLLNPASKPRAGPRAIALNSSLFWEADGPPVRSCSKPSCGRNLARRVWQACGRRAGAQRCRTPAAEQPAIGRSPVG